MNESRPAPTVLGYAGPSAERVMQPRALSTGRWMAAAWFAGMMLSGVASDRIKFPLEKKVAFTIAWAIVLVLFCFVGTGAWARVGRALRFAFWSSMLLVVMWFWN